MSSHHLAKENEPLGCGLNLGQNRG